MHIPGDFFVYHKLPYHLGQYQIKRVMERNGERQDEIINRLNMQMPLKIKLKYSDYILNNEGTKVQLKSKVSKLYAVLQKLI